MRLARAVRNAAESNATTSPESVKVPVMPTRYMPPGASGGNGGAGKGDTGGSGGGMGGKGGGGDGEVALIQNTV